MREEQEAWEENEDRRQRDERLLNNGQAYNRGDDWRIKPRNSKGYNPARRMEYGTVDKPISSND